MVALGAAFVIGAVDTQARGSCCPGSKGKAGTPPASINGKAYDVCSRTCGETLKKEPGDYLKNQEKVDKRDSEWKAELTPEQYRIMREKGTEPAFSGSLLDNRREGVYACAACGQPLFDSGAKFDSGSGWPSFYAPLENGKVSQQADGSHGMERTEVLCSRCDAHLGHVFNDGPKPTGQRYCINSASLEFEEKGGLINEPVASDPGADSDSGLGVNSGPGVDSDPGADGVSRSGRGEGVS